MMVVSVILLCVSLWSGVTSHGTESSGYVQVREDAHMFWWLMRAGDGGEDYQNYPLVLWLQGGPGASSTGFGNFAEIGPLFPDLSVRNNTWLNYANLLFVDNPVGAGYSYVTSEDAYVRNNSQIADDLLVLLKSFLQANPEFETIPLTIFSESYGGKMTSTFAVTLQSAITRKEVTANLKSVALGDSWISPIQSTASWSDYLYTMSLIDDQQKQEMDQFVWKMRTALKRKEGERATQLWLQLEDKVEGMTGGVNWYNILQSNSPAANWRNIHQTRNWHLGREKMGRGIHRHVAYFNDVFDDQLSDLMNGQVKARLGIPESVTWGGQSGEVFQKLSGDFMHPVVSDVEILLNSTTLRVIVYTGQLDLIVDTVGTEAWIKQLRWEKIDQFRKAPKQVFSESGGQTRAFLKKEDRLSLYWILNAGHMIPTDQLDVSVQMLRDVLKQ